MEDMISSDLASWPGLEPVNKGIRLYELTFEKQFVKRQVQGTGLHGCFSCSGLLGLVTGETWTLSTDGKTNSLYSSFPQ